MIPPLSTQTAFVSSNPTPYFTSKQTTQQPNKQPSPKRSKRKTLIP